MTIGGFIKGLKKITLIRLLVATLVLFSSCNFAAFHSQIEAMPSQLTLKTVIEYTLLLEPNILLEEAQQDVALGNFLINLGGFDIFLNWDVNAIHDRMPLLRSQEFIPGIFSNDSDQGLLNAGVSKTFLNGVSVNPTISMDRLQTNFKKAFDIPIENRAFINFKLDVPFFKGSMVGLTAKAAELNFLAEQYTYAQTISKSVLNSTLAYWSYLASYQSMNFLRKAADQDMQIIKGVNEMVDRGELASSDLTLAKANYEGRQSSYYAARQLYYSNKLRLATLMGIQTEKIAILPPPSTPFVKKRSMKFTQDELLPFFKNMCRYRTDLKAALLTIQANFALLKLQQTDLGPQFNSNASVGYRGLHEGTTAINAFSDNTKGPVASLGFNYQFPVQNNTAKGNYIAQSAKYGQSQIVYRDLLRTIKLNLIADFNQMQLAGIQSVYSKQAQDSYVKAVSNELAQLKAGETSLIDVLRVKDLLIQSQLSAIQSQSNYSQALASLYFDQGLLDCHDHLRCVIDLKPIS